MRWPFISRESHEETVGLLREQLAHLQAERTVLLDRLGSIGLGGPLFVKDVVVEQEPEEEEDLVDPDFDAKKLRALQGNPRELRREMQRQLAAAQRRRNPGVAYIPDTRKSVTAALDQAEAEGRRQA